MQHAPTQSSLPTPEIRQESWFSHPQSAWLSPVGGHGTKNVEIPEWISKRKPFHVSPRFATFQSLRAPGVSLC